MMTSDERKAVLEDEVLILGDSGEIPEIVYHATLHFLTHDPEGPAMILTGEELHLLQDAALGRYQEIVLRDINPDNRDLTIYRGVRRTLYNWQRMQDFCSRIDRDCSPFAEHIRSSFLSFMRQEATDIEAGNRVSVINCNRKMIADFSVELGLDLDVLPENWQSYCLTG